jgi:hypothetical protein
MPYMERVHTVVETKAYLQAARDAGLTEIDLAAIVDLIAGDPGAGDEIRGTGGCRKLRLAGRGKGRAVAIA